MAKENGKQTKIDIKNVQVTVTLTNGKRHHVGIRPDQAAIITQVLSMGAPKGMILSPPLPDIDVIQPKAITLSNK